MWPKANRLSCRKFQGMLTPRKNHCTLAADCWRAAEDRLEMRYRLRVLLASTTHGRYRCDRTLFCLLCSRATSDNVWQFLQAEAIYALHVAKMEGDDEATELLPTAIALAKEFGEGCPETCAVAVKRFVTSPSVTLPHAMAASWMAVYLTVSSQLKAATGAEAVKDEVDLHMRADTVAKMYMPGVMAVLHQHLPPLSLPIRLSALQLTAAMQDLHWQHRF
jgi:hypothetical protein